MTVIGKQNDRFYMPSRMTHSRRIALFILVLTSSSTGIAHAQAPEIIIELDRQEIYEGESVLYRVTLNHVENPTEPDLAGFDDFQIAKLGEQSLDSRQITIINGVRSEIVRRGRQYNYRLTPLRTGSLTIPSPSAEIDGEVVTGREVALRVIPPDDQDTAILEVMVDRDSVYPMQPFTITLTLAIKALPGALADRDPLSVQPDPPVLSVPWLDDEQVPDGLEPARSWREILEPMVSRRGHGVQINNIGSSSVFSLFGREATAFRPEPQQTTRTDKEGNDAEYWEFRFARTLIPRKLGDYNFSPVTLKGTFATDTQNGQLVGSRVFAVGSGATVNVQDVPLEGRPESFIGAVGNFEVSSQLAPRKARVGDPMTLTLTVKGQGSLEDARPPEIASLAGVEGVFRTYEATEETKGDSRRFTYSLRPLRSDASEFPSIPVSFFDVEEERYVTIGTDAIPVEISDAEELSDSEIVAARGDESTPAALQVSEGGVFANDSDLKSLRNQTIHPGRWLGLWAGLILCYVAATTLIGRVQRVWDDPALIRRRAAPARARKALQNIVDSGDSLDSQAHCEALHRVVAGLIADFADVPEAGLTPRDAKHRLDELGVEDGLRERVFDFLNQCDAARYGSAADDVARLQQDAHSLVESLETELRNKRG